MIVDKPLINDAQLFEMSSFVKFLISQLFQLRWQDCSRPVLEMAVTTGYCTVECEIIRLYEMDV
jgi:hypothetical protein